METNETTGAAVSAKPPTKDPVELLLRVKKSLEGMQISLLLIPILMGSVTPEIKATHPETYYMFKAALKNFIDAVEKELPDFKTAVEKLT